MAKRIPRDSNFELLRILSMIMILILHMGTHGLQRYINIEEFLTDSQLFLYHFARSLSIVSVNVYVLITGYFLSKSTFKLKKLILLFLETAFFSVFLYSTAIWTGFVDFSIEVLIQSIFSIIFGQYWFVTVYFVLYMLSPFLNRLINNINKKEHGILLLMLFLIISVWQFNFPINNLGVASGSGLIGFIFLYMLAAYIRNYNFVFFDFSKYIYIIIYIVLALFNSLIINANGVNNFYQYHSPLIIVMSYTLFQFFKHIKGKSRSINYMAKYVFGIYLVHEQPIIRHILWNKLGIIENLIFTRVNFIMIKFLILCFIIFLICWIFSYIFNKLFSVTLKKFVIAKWT